MGKMMDKRTETILIVGGLVFIVAGFSGALGIAMVVTGLLSKYIIK